MLLLSQERGDSFRAVDSVRIQPNGRFLFPGAFNATGFYRLAIADTDAVDIILDPREPKVVLSFDSLPLAAHLHVDTSDENQRLHEFNFVSKETQAVVEGTARQRQFLRPGDTTALAQLKQVEDRAWAMKEHYLDQLVAHAPDSYFAKVLGADKALRNAARRTPADVAAVFNFSDPALMRSSVYDRAVMTYLQNLQARHEDQFASAADSLLRLASGNSDCRMYMLGHLVDLFSTYGPASVLQHVLDRYVVPLGNDPALDPRTRAEVDRLLQLSVGKTAPDITLDDHGRQLLLSKLVRENRYTALFFYSSTCEHCHAQMPLLEADLVKYKHRGFAVIGIALDVDSTEFLKSIRENAIPWACFSEFNGWGASSAKAFMVKATPSFFLLDDHLRIVAKPQDAEELGRTLSTLLQ